MISSDKSIYTPYDFIMARIACIAVSNTTIKDRITTIRLSLASRYLHSRHTKKQLKVVIVTIHSSFLRTW